MGTTRRLATPKPVPGRCRSFLGGAIVDIRRGRRSGTMRATEKPAADLGAMTNDPALAMFADRRQSLNGAFKAVKSVLRASRYQVERFVIVITTNFTLRHWPPRSKYKNT